jgi:hypothetical protein
MKADDNLRARLRSLPPKSPEGNRIFVETFKRTLAEVIAEAKALLRDKNVIIPDDNTNRKKQ